MMMDSDQQRTTNKEQQTNLKLKIAANPTRPSAWAVILALGLVYAGWGTTNLAIKEGVKTLPPALFGGTCILAAGLVLLGYLALRGERLHMRRRDFYWMGLAGICLFVGGNGLITVAAKTLPSGLATVLVSMSPLVLAVLETVWPWGERLTLRGWLGLFAGIVGLLVVLQPRLMHLDGLTGNNGPLYALLSAFTWAIGSFVVRHHPHHGSHLTAAAYQMLIGGTALTLVGLAAGETTLVSPECFTPTAIFSFFYLLAVGSLIGFICYNWLLKRVSAVLAGTYAYVNPLVAIVVGWWLGHEELSAWIFGGMFIIVTGVALVRFGGVRHATVVDKPVSKEDAVEQDTEETWECEGVSG
jgi:drug/metabolite transporter (DMT)-like permease